MDEASKATRAAPWNKGKLVGQKSPFKLKEIWAIRVRLQLEKRIRELALFDLGIDSKLRACDLVKLRVRDICHGDRVASRTIVMQQKTGRPVQFEITEPTREAASSWIKKASLKSDDSSFRVEFTGRPTWVPGNTREFSVPGLRKLALIRPTTVRTRYGGQRHH